VAVLRLEREATRTQEDSGHEYWDVARSHSGAPSYSEAISTCDALVQANANLTAKLGRSERFYAASSHERQPALASFSQVASSALRRNQRRHHRLRQLSRASVKIRQQALAV
jgi:hypothetical protein